MIVERSHERRGAGFLAAYKEVGQALDRDPSQVMGVALRSFLEVEPDVRRALMAIDGIADPAERSFAAKLIGRSVLRAYEGILDSRHGGGVRLESNASLDDEDAIEAEAIRICSRP